MNTGSAARIKKIAILAVILILPGFLYYLLEQKGQNRYKLLPVFGEKTLTGTYSKRMGKEVPDTLYHQISPFTLTDQDGLPVRVLDSDSTITVVHFFYTRCHSLCRHVMDQMNRVAERFAPNHLVQFYSISVDTAYDRPAVLAAYAADYRAPEKRWAWLTGGPDDVYEIARRGFLVDAVQDTTREVAFIHSPSVILIDSQRRIRGYYEVTQPKETDRLIDEIKLLLVQEIRERSPFK